MTTEMLAFVLGGILLLIGILGGGFELRELKVPRVGWIPRLLATGAGLFFIFLGMSPSPSDKHDTPPGRAATLVDFKVYDKLYEEEGQVSASDTLIIDGRSVGTITVDKYSPEAALTVTVPEAGQHSYTIESTAILNVDGQLQEYSGVGQGMINVEAGKTFSVRGSSSGNTWLVTLVEAPK